MPAVIQLDGEHRADRMTLIANGDPARTVAWHDGRAVTAGRFLGDVANAAEQLRANGSVINLCENRYAFTVGFFAAVCRGQTTLLPSSRAPQAIREVQALHPGSYRVGDDRGSPDRDVILRLHGNCEQAEPPESSGFRIDSGLIAAIGFTSGSTGQPKPNAKTWQGLHGSSALNIAVLTQAAQIQAGVTANVVATVPAQHMYGMEMSVLLPLFGRFAVHSGRPFFPADIAQALAEIPEPRLLVTTPVHLKALLGHEIALPKIAAIVSATAPLSPELAADAERRLQTRVLELFGSTETCVIGHRRTAIESDWHLHNGVSLQAQPDGTLVDSDCLAAPVTMQDVIEPLPERRFRLHGRSGDLLEIAGKRASLADLTRRLQALDGVLDAVVFQPEASADSRVRRLAALVVAPQRTERDLLAELRSAVDPLFLPRPLRLVDALPRNETGKLPRMAMLDALRKTSKYQ
jgi:acyl-coenzyme A synthetase/AMP-(fatty) acid ligase